MLKPKVLLYIILGLTLLGLTLLALQWWVLGGILTAIGGGFLYLWWRMNQLLGISEAIMAGNFDAARAKLAGVRNPDKLTADSKTYYYYFQGTVEAQTGNWKASRAAFKTALETNRFRAIDERATALVMLAQVELRTNNREGAKRYLAEAQDLSPGPEIREQIKEVNRVMQQVGAAPRQQRGYYGRGR